MKPSIDIKVVIFTSIKDVHEDSEMKLGVLHLFTKGGGKSLPQAMLQSGWLWSGLIRALEEIPFFPQRKLSAKKHMIMKYLFDRVATSGVVLAPQLGSEETGATVVFHGYAEDLASLLRVEGSDETPSSLGATWGFLSLKDAIRFDPVVVSKALCTLRVRAEREDFFTFLDPPLTMPRLATAYEAIFGTSPDPRNFRRKMEAVLRPVGKLPSVTRGRPAMLYEFDPVRFQGLVSVGKRILP